MIGSMSLGVVRVLAEACAAAKWQVEHGYVSTDAAVDICVAYSDAVAGGLVPLHEADALILASGRASSLAGDGDDRASKLLAEAGDLILQKAAMAIVKAYYPKAEDASEVVASAATEPVVRVRERRIGETEIKERCLHGVQVGRGHTCLACETSDAAPS